MEGSPHALLSLVSSGYCKPSEISITPCARLHAGLLQKPSIRRSLISRSSKRSSCFVLHPSPRACSIIEPSLCAEIHVASLKLCVSNDTPLRGQYSYEFFITRHMLVGGTGRFTGRAQHCQLVSHTWSHATVDSTSRLQLHVTAYYRTTRTFTLASLSSYDGPSAAIFAGSYLRIIGGCKGGPLQSPSHIVVNLLHRNTASNRCSCRGLVRAYDISWFRCSRELIGENMSNWLRYLFEHSGRTLSSQNTR